MKTVFLRHSRVLVAFPLAWSLVACSSSGSMDAKGPAAKSPTTVAKSTAGSGTENDESADADMPQEIAGGFLTCAYVTPEESGFAESADNMPVGCAVVKDGEKITDPNLSYKIGLYLPNKNPDTMDAKVASASSKWHGYGNLPRANKTRHFLGMTVTDTQNNRPEETVYFPVKDLELDNSDALFNLVGGIPSAGVFNMEKIMSGRLGQLLGGVVGYDNKATPILPAASCSRGVISEDYDIKQFTDPFMGIAVAADELQKKTDVQGIRQERNQTKEKVKPKTVDCFVLAKEAAKDDWRKPIGAPKPVLEGEGCLFLQSPAGFVIYDQAQIEKYNIKKEALETYVKARMCPDAK